MIRQLMDGLVSVALAPACAACGAPLDCPTRSAVCEACWHSIESQAACAAVRPGSGTLTWTAAIGDYDGALREVLHALKYRGRQSLGPQLGTLMRAHGQRVLTGADAVVPVPLHWWRLWRRGFNQSAALAEGLGLPVLPALRRTRHTASQTGLDAGARQANVRLAFRLRRRISVAGARLVLVDDVSTTGATLEACATELARRGAREVRALTAARVVTRRPPARPG